MLTAVSYINEFCQVNGGNFSDEMVGRRGPDHAPTFTVKFTVNTLGREFSAEATAASKKVAKTEAAGKVWEQIENRAPLAA